MRTVSITVIANVSPEDCGTYAIFFAISLNDMSATSMPSMSTLPSVGSRILLMQYMKVDFPTPLGPSMHTSPGSDISRLIPFQILVSP